MMIVYLAGPITGKTYAGATDWRHDFGLILPKIIKLSPMRGKDYLKELVDDVMPNAVNGSNPRQLMSTPRAVFSRDLFDIRRSDAIVANFLHSTERSIGTVFELGYARSLGKLIIVVMDEQNVHEHAFIREAASFVVPTLKDAEDLLEQLS